MGDGGPPHACSRPSASAIRCRCMASACRSAAPRPLDREHLARLQTLVERYRAGLLLRASRLVEPRRGLSQRPSAAALQRGDAGARRRAHRRGAGGARARRCCSKIPSTYVAVRGEHDERDRLPRRGRRGAPAAACCSTSTTSSSPPSTTASTADLSRRVSRSTLSARSISPAMPRTRRRRRAAPDRRPWPTGRRSGLDALRSTRSRAPDRCRR